MKPHTERHRTHGTHGTHASTVRETKKRREAARAYIRLYLGDVVARAASHIRSKRAASIAPTIAQTREDYIRDYGERDVDAFFDCTEQWLVERGGTAAAAALRSFIAKQQSGTFDRTPVHSAQEAPHDRSCRSH